MHPKNAVELSWRSAFSGPQPVTDAWRDDHGNDSEVDRCHAI